MRWVYDKVSGFYVDSETAPLRAAAIVLADKAAEAKEAEANKSYTEKVMGPKRESLDDATAEEWDASWRAMYGRGTPSVTAGAESVITGLSTVPTEGYFNTPKHTTTKDKQVGGSHYTKMTIQPREYILANQMGYDEANVVKYVSRHQDKGGAQDIKKAIQYLEFILEDQYNGNN
jgi:hypothetical protein